MQLLGKRTILAYFTFSVLAYWFRSVHCTCLGNSCPQEHEAATSQRLLGASFSSCEEKSYPQDGSKLHPVNTSAPVTELRWVGLLHEQDKYIFALTSPQGSSKGGALWRSDAYGHLDSWKDITDQLPGARDAQPGDTEDYAGVIAMHMNPARPKKLLIQGAGYQYWVTEDYGVTFNATNSPGGTLGFHNSLKLHPHQPDWILAKARRNECLEDLAAFSKWCAFDLFVSKDFGASWMNLTANSKGAIASFVDFEWGAVLHSGRNRRLVDETILATAYESAEHMKGPYPNWDKDQHFVVSHSLFQTQHEKVVSCGNQFEVVGHKVYLALPSDCPMFPDGGKRDVCKDASKYGATIMYVSYDEAQTFSQACLPVKDLDLSYSMTHAHPEGGLGSFIMVDHDEEDAVSAAAPISNVYAAGDNSTIFSLVLPRALRRGEVTDFSRVEGLPGIYLANQLTLAALEQRDHSRPDYENFVQTKISFNGGAHWQDLQRPDEYRHASCDQCSRLADPSTCRLHLHGPSSLTWAAGSRASFYSHASTPGLVLAVGNTGEFLDLAADDACTWLSSDGGLTWQDVAEQPHIYDFGDLGGLVLMAEYESQQPADHAHFSLDRGACWHTVHFSEAIDVQNIRVEPRASSHLFVVHGKACRKRDAHPTCTHEETGTAPAGKMYVIDLEEIMGSDFAVCSKDAYETWSPPQPGQCLLGRNLTLHRRKPEAACFNARGYEHAANSSVPCPCEAADLACEIGYEWIEHDCRPIKDIESLQCPAIWQGAYKLSSTHKRLIQGDVCADLTRVITDTDGRGNAVSQGGGGQTSGGGGSGWHLVAGILLVLVIIVGFGFACWRLGLGSTSLSCLEDVWSGVIAFLYTAYTWLRERMPGSIRRRPTEEAYFQPLSGGDNDDFALRLDEEDVRSPPVFSP